MKYLLLLFLLMLTFVTNGQTITDSCVKRVSIDSIDVIVDSLLNNKDNIANTYIESRDSLIYNQTDSIVSLKKIILGLKNRSNTSNLECVSLSRKLDSLKSINTLLNNKYREIIPVNNKLVSEVRNLQEKIQKQNVMVNEQIQKIAEKEKLFKQKELIYTQAIQNSKIDKIKLEGNLSTMDAKLEGKNREIALLAQSIADQRKSITEKKTEIDNIREKRENINYKLDILKDNLSRTKQKLVITQEKLKYNKQELKNVKAQLTNSTNTKKKIRIVQGIAIRNFRTPLYSLQPKSSVEYNTYVINNENSGSYEFDFITGASFRIIDLTKKKNTYTSDIGFFVGFGGKNLFKNFYFGPNIKLFDVIHMNFGINISEYRLLKSGFYVGDQVKQGASIPTVSKWQFAPYMSVSFDLGLLSKIAGKL